MYLIATVSDYKGGELHMRTDLSKEEVGEELAEIMEERFEEGTSKEDIIKDLEKNGIETCLYAGSKEYGEFCGEIYDYTNGSMDEVPLSHFNEEIADTFIRWFNEDY